MDDKSGVWYLAGPMSGYPQFNFPAFQAAAWALRALGYQVVSPHEEDPPEIQTLAWKSTTGDPADLQAGPGVWGDRLAHDVKLISNGVTGLIMLPKWEQSRGACLEATVGVLAGKQFRFWDGKVLDPMPPSEVVYGIGFQLNRVNANASR